MPFHKLTQWLAYSLVEPLERVLGWKVDGLDDMTGLPEYRNGAPFARPQQTGDETLNASQAACSSILVCSSCARRPRVPTRSRSSSRRIPRLSNGAL